MIKKREINSITLMENAVNGAGVFETNMESEFVLPVRLVGAKWTLELRLLAALIAFVLHEALLVFVTAAARRAKELVCNNSKHSR